MQCLACGGGLELAGGGQYARCTRCLALYQNGGGSLTPIHVEAPGGGNNPEFNAIFAQQLGFGPPPRPQGNLPDIGVRLRVDGVPIDIGSSGGIDTRRLENRVKQKAEQKIWGLVIGGVILLVILVTFAGIGIYVWLQMNPSGSGAAAAAPGGGSAASWDGKSTFACGGNDNVRIEGVTASLSAGPAIKATGNCRLELVDVTVSAPVAIDAGMNAKVAVRGGSITGTTTAIVAGVNAEVAILGAKVTGKTQTSANGKVTGLK